MSPLNAVHVPSMAPGEGTLTGVVFLTSTRVRSGLAERLRTLHPETRVVSDVRDALSQLRAERDAACIVDLAGGRDVLALVRGVRAEHASALIVGVADVANPLIAGEAWQAGVSEVLPWPFAATDLSLALANARDALSATGNSEGAAVGRDVVFAHSPAMQRVVLSAREAAESTAAVWLSGELETGRGLLSRVIHRLSPESSARPFVTVECAGRSGEDVDRELFGLVQSLEGNRRSGPAVRVTSDSALSRSHGGTLVLRDVADAPDRVQAKLARILRDGEALVGATRKVVPIAVRAMAIVDPSVETAISEGRLRQDLFARVNQLRIDLPPLRRRREDIPQLAAHFLHEACASRHLAPKAFSRSALRLLLALPWPGNAGELKTIVEGLAEAVNAPVIQLDDLLERANLDGLATRFEPGVTLREAKARFERECIAAVIMRHRGRMGEAARALGIQRTNLYRKVRQLKVATGSGLVRR